MGARLRVMRESGENFPIAPFLQELGLAARSMGQPLRVSLIPPRGVESRSLSADDEGERRWADGTGTHLEARSGGWADRRDLHLGLRSGPQADVSHGRPAGDAVFRAGSLRRGARGRPE